MTPNTTTARKYPFYLACVATVGYLMAVVPPIVLDPLLTTHVRYHARHYQDWWIIFPCTLVIATGTYIATSHTRLLRRILAAILPLLLMCLVSLPFFRPEFPHGNITYTAILLTAIISLTVWISDSGHTPPDGFWQSDAQDRRTYLQEMLLFHRTALFTLIGGYLALLVTAIVSAQHANSDMISDKGELFVENLYSGIHFGFMSLLVLTGPVYQLAKRHHEVAAMLITAKSAPRPTP